MAFSPPGAPVALRVGGARVEHGLPLADVATLADGVVAALRGHDRARRGLHPTAAGPPDRRARAAVDLRLVGWAVAPGGGAGRLLLAPPPAPAGGGLVDGDPSLALLTLADLAATVAAGLRPSTAVMAALQRARAACGAGGQIVLEPLALAGAPVAAVELAGPGGVEVDPAASTGRGSAEAPRARSVMGHIHSVNLESRRLALRGGDGCEWICRFDEHLVAAGQRLLGRPVLVHGWGRLRADGRGSLRIEAIAPADQGHQAALFGPPPGAGAPLAEGVPA